MPTQAEIEAAAKALADCAMEPLDELSRKKYEADARAALEAAESVRASLIAELANRETTYLHPKAEEQFCDCGRAHSLEGHSGFCAWLRVKPLMDAVTEALNWFTPPNDFKPFPAQQLASALEFASGRDHTEPTSASQRK